MAGMVQAIDGFICKYNGEDVTIRAGDILDDTHQIVKTTPADWWRPLKSRFAVEEATAKPGRKRAAAIPSDAAD